jgi:protein TonB
VKSIQRALQLATMSLVGAIMAACSTAHRDPVPAVPPAPVDGSVSPGPTVDAPAAVVIPPLAQLPTVSYATSALAYRRDAATHLYALNAARIYKGVLRPHLYAIGVLDVDIDRQGQVTGISWRRAPKHAPEVMAEIVRTVRQAAPYPVPSRMGRVTYSDVWLWDKSGQFQLDTLTEGQM